VSEIEGVFHDQKKTKIKEISFESEASSGRWDALMLNPEKNKKQLDSEFRSLQQENVILIIIIPNEKPFLLKLKYCVVFHLCILKRTLKVG